MDVWEILYAVLGLVLGLGFIGLTVYLVVSRKMNRWHILSEYERGIIYRQGMAFQDVGPGTYKLRIGRDFLVIVDMRPVAFDPGQAAVSTLDGCTALYSITGKTQIEDVRKAVYCASNYHHAALAKTAATVRRMLNDNDSDDIRRHTEAVRDGIAQAVRDSVGELGMRVVDFQLSQLRLLEPASPKLSNAE